MRITGGILRGRQVRVPGSGVRPTQDMVRQALFSILGAKVAECRFLDLFAGSGVVGMEAFSRGAEQVCWVESGRSVLTILEKNVHDLCGGEGKIVRMDVLRFLGKRGFVGSFDVIFADPPYGAMGRGAGAYNKKSKPVEAENWQVRLLNVLSGSDILAPDGVFVLERDATEELIEVAGWVMISEKRYGGSKLCFFMKGSGE